MHSIIEVENLRKTYGKVVAVDHVSFNVVEGEIFGLLGPNGAGKTTTVECLQGLRHGFSGNVKVLGLDPHTEAQALRQKIGSQLQQSAIPDRIKVWEALDLFATFTPNSSDWRILMEQWG
ncbi:MAG: ATP-binding cassette domain-containing protein, partial [Chloroflexi bacterium]|nr:ATP-binding cassette domain-containing protein [Chloroflexota bacterium]